MPRFIENPEEYGLPEDLAAIGGEINTKTLIEAYQGGIFPWPESDELPVLWFCPNPRGILRHEKLHFSRSLKRTLRQKKFKIQSDTAFDDVITRCQKSVRKGQGGTWITPNMKSAYMALHRDGIAHSVEAWADGKLVGGLYGVYLNNTFSGESMFHTCSDASKVALATLMTALNAAGVHWMDTQMITPVVEALGGELIS
ncbi:MAG: leucyl/phenylalanyl-tRNA--protein transferase, partial [Deltaproteobacteria bacterium]|nr:leucyl/phenylalanyl-tRNA--protein transferase [Deltaproteobacteria bacterium]